MFKLSWRILMGSIIVAAAANPARADVLFSQAAGTSGAIMTSAYYAPDGSDWDEAIWDGFTLPAAGNITEIRWRGAYPGGGTSGGNVVDFEISIWGSIPVGTQPDITAPLVSYLITDNGGGGAGNAGERFVGNVGGTNFYEYAFVLPQTFVAAGGRPYWIQIIAWQNGFPNWGMATAAGSGTHFVRTMGAAGDPNRFIYRTGDAVFSLIGTPTNCSVPVITQNPVSMSTCWRGGLQASFTVAATGAGPFTYKWRLNGYPVNDGPNGGGTGGGAVISGASAATLHIDGVSYWHDVGTYTCEVWNVCGYATSAGAVLDAPYGAPAVTGSPGSTSACQGGAVSLTTAYTNSGSVPPTITWYKDNVLVVNGTTSAGTLVSGASTATLSLSNLRAGDQGWYSCRVSNPCGSPSSTPALVSVCAADYNWSGAVSVQDIFDFLGGYFAGDALADVNGSGAVSVQDIFDFLALYFAGCV